VLTHRKSHLETHFLHPLIERDHVERGHLDIDMLDSRANRVDRQRINRRDRHGMVAFIDPQESDLELQSVDGLVDVVGQTRVEDVVVNSPGRIAASSS